MWISQKKSSSINCTCNKLMKKKLSLKPQQLKKLPQQQPLYNHNILNNKNNKFHHIKELTTDPANPEIGPSHENLLGMIWTLKRIYSPNMSHTSCITQSTPQLVKSIEVLQVAFLLHLNMPSIHITSPQK